MRSILHIKIDSLPAVVEQKRRPELRGKAVVVCEPRGNTSGVVVSASREARGAGVEEGMSVRQSQRVCPGAVVISADHGAYRQVSALLLDILAQYSPLLEPDSLGSAYLDITASRNLFGDARQIGALISSQVSDLGLPISIGSASSKLIAGIASGMGKPFAEIKPGFESSFLSPLPVRALGSVNCKVGKRLGELGVHTIGQLAMIPERLLVRQFGPVGSVIYKQSLGIDSSQVKAAYPSDVINSEHMFENAIEEPAQIEEHLREMTVEALVKLRKRGGLAGEITLTLFVDRGLWNADRGLEEVAPSPLAGEGWGEGETLLGRDLQSRPQGQPEDFQSPFSISAYFRFKKPTDSAAAIVQALGKLLISKMTAGMQIYAVQIVLSDLTQGSSSQLCLIGNGERRDRLDRVVELINERFGDGSMCVAASLAPSGRARVLSRIAA